MRIAAWNVARALSNENRSNVVDGIRELDADILVLSESFDAKGNGLIGDIPEMWKLKYDTMITRPYKDTDPHPSGEQYISMLSRVPLQQDDQARFGTRNGLRAVVQLKRGDFELLGVHMDDRSAAQRLVMARAMIGIASDTLPTIIAGDMNDMHADDSVARLLRRPLVRGLAAAAPHPRVQSLATRVCEMAEGSTIGLFENNGFIDADPLHQTTMRKAGLPITVDHIMHRGEIAVGEFMNHNLPGSDHRAISVEVA